MRAWSGPLLSLLLAAPYLVASPPEKADQPKAAIRFPELVQPPPPPPPPPVPQPISKLTPAKLYMIDADVPLLVFASPPGLVKVTKEAGPIRVRGQFVDGDGYETRDYKGKTVVTVEAIEGAVGTVELIIVPVPTTSESEAVRKQLEVAAGKGPQPPPDVDPDVDPKPVVAKGLRVVFWYENRNKLTPEQDAVISSGKVEAYLNAKCVQVDGWPEWRRWDQDVVLASDETQTMRDLHAGLLKEIAAKKAKGEPYSLPLLLVANDLMVKVYSGDTFPKSESEALSILKQHGGE